MIVFSLYVSETKVVSKKLCRCSMQGVLSFSLYDVAVKQICSFRVDIEFFIVDLPFL